MILNNHPIQYTITKYPSPFLQCAFMRQTKGQTFINTVKAINDRGQEVISYDNVVTEMAGTATGEENLRQQQQENPLDHDPAVQVSCRPHIVSKLDFSRISILHLKEPITCDIIITISKGIKIKNNVQGVSIP